MKTLFQISLLFWLVATAAAQETPKALQTFDWRDLSAQIPNSQIVSMDGISVLKIENTNDAPLQVSLFEISNPPISSLTYAVSGQIKYENVRGNGYLEMWNYFPRTQPNTSETKYFPRTLGESGAMGKITGSSDWRQFSLPFDRTGASNPPSRLDINLFLAGRGTVYLQPATLVEFKTKTSWWSARQSGMIGGVGGAIIGCFGSLIGILGAKGKARNFVLTMLKIFIGVGILLLAVGIIAIASKQPYAVWYPLILPGFILTLVFGVNLRSIKKRYDDLEIRRMTSLDV
jgi:hypothetical protein